jgi:hypothetical protein
VLLSGAGGATPDSRPPPGTSWPLRAGERDHVPDQGGTGGGWPADPAARPSGRCAGPRCSVRPGSAGGGRPPVQGGAHQPVRSVPFARDPPARADRNWTESRGHTVGGAQLDAHHHCGSAVAGNRAGYCRTCPAAGDDRTGAAESLRVAIREAVVQRLPHQLQHIMRTAAGRLSVGYDAAAQQPRRPAAIRVRGPRARDVQLPVHRRVSALACINEIHGDLQILDPAGGAGVLTLDPDGPGALLRVARRGPLVRVERPVPTRTVPSGRGGDRADLITHQ